jgi:hypothetical protein
MVSKEKFVMRDIEGGTQKEFLPEFIWNYCGEPLAVPQPGLEPGTLPYRSTSRLSYCYSSPRALEKTLFGIMVWIELTQHTNK